MRCVLGAVLTAALLVVSAHSLSCYSCSNGLNAAACKTTINCSYDLNSYCVKVEDHEEVRTSSFVRSVSPTPESSVENVPVGKASAVSGENVYRDCSALCREGTGPNGGYYYYSHVYCCRTDLCNGANTVRIIAILLPLAAAFLLGAGL